jgi:D-glycero-alpha-D-manno-heptose 1-phosphate guanylyltransferase
MSEAVTVLSDITAVILAGGRGIRLRPVVADRPKVLAEILGRPFLRYLLDELAIAGLRRVVLCTGYMSENIYQTLGDTYASLNLFYSREGKPLGTGGALRLALPELTSDIVLVMNGDSYIEADLGDFLRWFAEKGALAALILTRVADTKRYGRVVSSLDGQILLFEEKVENGGPGWINAGLYLLRTELISNIPSGRAYSLERDFFPGLIGKGLYGYQCKGEFIDIGTPDSYRKAKAFFLKIHKWR